MIWLHLRTNRLLYHIRKDLKKFVEVGVRVIYFPYTKSTSSTVLNETLEMLRKH
jgi:hypothetical protein